MYIYIYQIVVRIIKKTFTKSEKIDKLINTSNFFIPSFRLVKSITLKVVIDNWMQWKRVNDSLPANERKQIEKSIDNLRLPCF